MTGAYLYVFIGGDTPPDPNAMQFVGFDNADAGKNAWWAARWANSKQEPGPWSETVMATFAG